MHAYAYGICRAMCKEAAMDGEILAIIAIAEMCNGHPA